MVTLFDQEKVMEIHDYNVAEAARKEGLLVAIKNLVKNSGMTIEEAMAMLGIPVADRFQYAEKLKQ